MSKTGYTLTITSPAFTGLYASGGGGGNCGTAFVTNTYGGGEGGTFAMNWPQSALPNTGSGGGGDRSYWSTNTNQGVNSTTTVGGSGVVLFFY